MHKAVAKIWNVSASMKTGLVLLFVFAGLSLIGTFIPQDALSPDKAAEISGIWRSLGLTHLYTSKIYILVAYLLSLNLLTCTVQRWPAAWARFRQRPGYRDAKDIEAMAAYILLPVSGERVRIRQTLAATLRKHHYRVSISQEGNGWRGWADKGRAGVWGSFLVHLGFLTLIVGMAVGHQFGFKGFYMSPAGSSYALGDILVQQGTVKSDLSVHIHSAQEKFDAAGNRDNWYTELSVLRNGVELKRALISVNHPLTVEGISFYQASFAPGVSLVADMKGEQTLLALQPRGQNYFHAPGTSLYLICDQIGVKDGKTVISYQVFDDKTTMPVQTGELVQGEHTRIQDAYDLTLLGPANFTGLQIKEDPGVPMVWLGCLLAVLGLILSFYFKQTQIWFAWRENGSTPELALALATTTGAEGAQELLDRLVLTLNKSFYLHHERGEYAHELD